MTNGPLSSGTARKSRGGLVGYGMAAGAAFLWATSATAGKGLFAAGITPIQLVQARSLLSAAVLGAILVTGRRALLPVRGADLSRLAALGVLALAGMQICYFSAIRRIPVATAILLQYQSVVLVFAFGAIFLGRRPSGRELAAVAGALVGCFLVVGGADLASMEKDLPGVAFGLAAAVCFAAYTLGSARLIRRLSPWTVLFWALCFSFAASLAVDPGAAPRALRLSPAIGLELAAVALLGTLVPLALFSFAMARIGAAHASVVAVLEPVFAAVMAFVFLGEALAPPKILGGVLVVGAVAMLSRARVRDRGFDTDPGGR